METITLLCTNNDRTKEAEVLERNDKYMKVQVPGTQLFIELFRDDTSNVVRLYDSGKICHCREANWPSGSAALVPKNDIVGESAIISRFNRCG